jgi:hypothetical protein
MSALPGKNKGGHLKTIPRMTTLFEEPTYLDCKNADFAK